MTDVDFLKSLVLGAAFGIVTCGAFFLYQGSRWQDAGQKRLGVAAMVFGGVLFVFGPYVSGLVVFGIFN